MVDPSSQLIGKWYGKAQIDYAQLYMSLYAAFNTWYRVTTGSSNDRHAINQLRLGNKIWSLYEDNLVMAGLRPVMKLLVELTQREPLSYATPHWKGEVSSSEDWPSLVEYWYRVRCLVMHGAEIRSVYIYLAYETLNVFMGEIVHTLQD